MEPLNHVLEVTLFDRLAAASGLDLDLQTPTVGQDARQVRLAGYTEPHDPPAQPRDAHVRTPQAQVRACAEGPEDLV